MKKTVGVIGIPTFGKVTMDFTMAYNGIQKPLASAWMPYLPRNKRIDEARTEIVEFALAQNAEYIFFIDDDVLVPPYALLRMLDRHKDIVNGVYIGKCEDGLMPLLFREQISGPYVDWKKGEFFQIDSAGCGCTLIKTDVFRRLEKPWFDIFFNLTGMNNSEYGQGTEDLFFYGKCRKAGIEVWADTSVLCGHIDINTGKVFVVPSNHPNITGEPKFDATDRKVLDLGCGEKNAGYNYFGENAKITRVDIREEVHPDVRMDIRNLESIPDEFFDLVHASNVLQSFNTPIVPEILKEWFKKVKIGGEMIVVVPNLTKLLKEVEEKGVLTPEVSNLLFGAKMHRKDLSMTGFTMRMLKSLFTDNIHGMGVKSVKIDVDSTEFFLKVTCKRFKSSIAHKDQGVFLHNYARQPYKPFGILRANQTIVSSDNAYIEKMKETPREFSIIGLDGVVTGDQIAFNTLNGKWYRNGIEYTGIDTIDLSKVEKFEVIWSVPSLDVDINSPDYVSTVGYKVGNSSIIAKVLSDGLVDFRHVIKKPKVTVAKLLKDEKAAEKKKKVIKKKSASKKDK